MLAEGAFLGDEGDVHALLNGGSADRRELLGALHAWLRTQLSANGESSTGTTHEARAHDGAEEQQPSSDGWPAPRTQGFVEEVPARGDVLERDHEAKEVVAQLRRSQPAVSVLVGEPGSGRSTTMARVVAILGDSQDARRVYRVSPSTLGPSPASALRMVLEDAPQESVLVIDDVDDVAALGTARPDGEVISLLRGARHQAKSRLVLVTTPKYIGRLEVYAHDLAERLERVDVHEFSPEAVETIVAAGAQESLSTTR